MRFICGSTLLCGRMDHVDVSVIVTVLNEKYSVQRLLGSLALQTRTPDQVVICDGGSTDGTVQAIKDSVAQFGDRLGKIEVFVLQGANISEGRNAAIERAHGPLIASTDAGVRLDSRWLESLTDPWEETPDAAQEPLAAGGFFVPDAQTVFEIAMSATVLPAVEDVEPSAFLPSSRSVAFLKSTWAAAGGYPEWLDYCEDLVFDFRVNKLASGTKTGFAWRPGATVYFRPRSSLRAFWRQYYRYARGDGKADLWRKRHAVRYATYFVVVPVLLALTTRGGVARLVGVGGMLTGAAFYCWRPWQRLRALGAGFSDGQLLRAALLVPLIRAVGDVAKMAGYPVGLLWRRRNRHRPEIHWRDGR